ncbi:5'/3'-nucleotidase SurE [Thermoplasmatales archaeon ex4484_36]|uniref:5'-nucleotidase SurE n=1 Tax=Thermosulfidibacter takaii TaxID=412593 RepID=A0A7C0U603_9BACT|nr:MAG: 5'/3'-nucleotidase SurE [Thermoplasmatales archaeon ex4484_36]RLD99797.1 MAG: 5'/3'-nucleotidase SurE [Aquificota bacterium]HDD52550.1 5'/3'-nucleotidase SurE [Thermosulfidibacter takaii]
MVILLSNDDGVYAQGLMTLKETLEELAEVYVVAPDREKSAVSHAVTLHRPLRVERIKERVYAVDGTPTDCVILAVNKLLGKRPDLLISGINQGGNMGDDVTYSGTVSAAMEGTILGIPSIAVSLVVEEYRNYENVALFVKNLVEWMNTSPLPSETFLNINVPDREEYHHIKGVMWTRQGKRVYSDSIYELVDPRGKKYYWIGGVPLEDVDNGEDTDIAAVSRGFISITPIHLDLTDYRALDRLRKKGNLSL